MDHTKESSDFSFELLVSIKEGLESLEQGLRKKAISAIQKRLRAKDAQNRSIGTPSDLERQFRKLMTSKKEKESKMKNTVEIGKVLVVVERFHSSNFDHNWEVYTFQTGDEVTDERLANGHLLSEGESVTVDASVDINNLDYRPGTVTVTNRAGVPFRKVNAGRRLATYSDQDAEPFVVEKYDRVKHGPPQFKDFCPRGWWEELEEYALAVDGYLQETFDTVFGWEALKKFWWINTNNEGDCYMAIIAARMHLMGEEILPALKKAKEFTKLQAVNRRLNELR